MSNWRVIFIATLSFFTILGGLLILALPASYEGSALYTLNPSHAFSLLDLVGLGILLLGGGMAWGAGMLWQRWMNNRG